jgi:hypothetical protein
MNIFFKSPRSRLERGLFCGWAIILISGRFACPSAAKEEDMAAFAAILKKVGFLSPLRRGG